MTYRTPELDNAKLQADINEFDGFVGSHGLDEFVIAYLETALSMCDDLNGNPLDETYAISTFSTEAVQEAMAECAQFRAENPTTLDLFYSQNYFSEDYGGYLFWLSRNRHGHGFFAYETDAAIALQESAHTFGERTAYAVEGKIYFAQG